MAGRFLWKGRTTGGRYEYDQADIPAALLSSTGQPLDGVTFNGETLVIANEDMSVAHAQAKGPPPGATDIWSAYVATSTWDQTTH
jgi:hypothetical protein